VVLADLRKAQDLGEKPPRPFEVLHFEDQMTDTFDFEGHLSFLLSTYESHSGRSKRSQRRGARSIEERRRTRVVRRSEAMERNEAYESFSAACYIVSMTLPKCSRPSR